MYVGTDRIAVVGTINLTASDLEIEGGADLTATSVTVATAASIVAVNAGSDAREIIGPVTLNAGGTLDTSVDTEDFTVTGNLLRPGGTITGNAGGQIICSGTYSGSYSAGALTNVYIRMTGTGEMDESQKPFEKVTVASTGTITLAGIVYTERLEIEVGGSLLWASGKTLTTSPTGNDFCDIQGTCTADITLGIQVYGSRSNSGDIVTTGVVRLTATNDTLTQSGALSAGSTVLYTFVDNNYARLDATGPSASLDDVTLGTATGTNRYGILDVSGVSGAVQINSLVDAAGGSSALALGAKDITIGAGSTWDGTDITCTATGGNVILANGSTISNCVFDNPVYVKNGVPGGGNTNVFFLASGGTSSAGPDGVGWGGRSA